MKRSLILIVLLFLSSCSVVKPAPEQEAIDAMIKAFSPTDGAKGWDKQEITDFTPLRLTKADQANNVQERACITLSYIEYEEGEWKDKSISYSMEKTDDTWQDDENLMKITSNDNMLDVLLRIRSGNCDFARDAYGVP
jgi:hypothetical protein